MNDSVRRTNTLHDPVTVAFIAVVVCALTSLMHEAFGHGLACLLVGVKPLGLSSIRLDWDWRGVPMSSVRVIAASGTLVNLVGFALFAGLLRRMREAAAATRYFLWLAASANLLLGASYLFFAFAPFADWYWFVQGLTPRSAWQVGLFFVGLALYVGVGLPLLKQGLRPFLWGDSKQARRQAGLLTWLPYAIFGMVAITAASLHRQGSLVGLAAGQWFGGAALLFYLPFFVRRVDIPMAGQQEVVSRSWGWIAAGVITLGLFIFILGPGIHFS